MPRDYVSLGECRWPTVRLYCPSCHRFAQFKLSGLVKRFGPEQGMPGLLTELRPCDRVTFAIGQAPCQLCYWDAMTPDDRREALAAMAGRGGLPKGWTAE